MLPTADPALECATAVAASSSVPAPVLAAHIDVGAATIARASTLGPLGASRGASTPSVAAARSTEVVALAGRSGAPDRSRADVPQRRIGRAGRAMSSAGAHGSCLPATGTSVTLERPIRRAFRGTREGGRASVALGSRGSPGADGAVAVTAGRTASHSPRLRLGPAASPPPVGADPGGGPGHARA
jgi:hypothetical protein